MAGLAGRAAPTSSAAHAPAGAKTIPKLTFLPDHPVGADQLDQHIRRTVKTDYHPVGTCRMGHDDDPEAVVGADLRVHGIDGLRVIDASVMPKLVSANTNAPTMAVADRAVSLMRDKA